MSIVAIEVEEQDVPVPVIPKSMLMTASIKSPTIAAPIYIVKWLDSMYALGEAAVLLNAPSIESVCN